MAPAPTTKRPAPERKALSVKQLTDMTKKIELKLYHAGLMQVRLRLEWILTAFASGINLTLETKKVIGSYDDAEEDDSELDATDVTEQAIEIRDWFAALPGKLANLSGVIDAVGWPDDQLPILILKLIRLAIDAKDAAEGEFDDEGEGEYLTSEPKVFVDVAGRGFASMSADLVALVKRIIDMAPAMLEMYKMTKKKKKTDDDDAASSSTAAVAVAAE